MKPLMGLHAYLSKSSLEPTLVDLLNFRVSQINGCAYCLDMHSKEARVKGESEQRLYMVSAWKDTEIYSNREKAALDFAEALTKLPSGELPNDVWEEATNHFSEDELIALIMTVVAINGFNRINIAIRHPAGNYTPGQFAATKS